MVQMLTIADHLKPGDTFRGKRVTAVRRMVDIPNAAGEPSTHMVTCELGTAIALEIELEGGERLIRHPLHQY